MHTMGLKKIRNLVIALVCMLFLHIGKSDKEDLSYCGNSSPEDDNYSECYHESKTGRFLNFVDSVNTMWCALDVDETDFLTHEEILSNIIETSVLDEETAIERANLFIKYLDDNLDSVISVYELRVNVHRALSSNQEIESLPEDEWSFHQWIKQFVGESPQRYSLFLVKLYQLMDEDINGKLTWKEIRMTIRMAELFGGIPQSNLMEEEEREILVSKIKKNDQKKYLDLDEFLNLLLQLEVSPDAVFYEWICEYLRGDTDFYLVSESTRREFAAIDFNSDGVISKGEFIATLHKHRKNYYTDIRINRRFTRADRNEDGIISFNEYAFLENLKHPTQK